MNPWPLSVISYNQTWGDPVPLHALGQVGDVKYTDSWPGGPLSAEWTIDLPVDFSHRALRNDRLIQIRDGLTRVWSGRIGEPTRGTPWTFSADGLQALLADYLANGAVDPNVAIAAAITRGLPLTVPNTLIGPAAGGTNVTCADVLNAACQVNVGYRWKVSAGAMVSTATDPTTPTWMLCAVDVPGGRTLTGYASALFAQYTTTSSQVATVAATANPTSAPPGLGVHEAFLDLTSRGAMTGGQAQAFVDALFTRYYQRLPFTGDIPVQDGALLTMGGVQARATDVRAGQMVRFRGVEPDPEFGEMAFTTTVDVVIGQVSFDSTQPVPLTLTPVDSQSTDLQNLLSQVLPSSVTDTTPATI